VDYEKGARICNWFINHVHDGLSDPKLTFFTDKTNFNLSQNNMCWSSETPRALIKLPLYDQKGCVWCIRALCGVFGEIDGED
jgi:hypothetical protein